MKIEHFFDHAETNSGNSKYRVLVVDDMQNNLLLLENLLNSHNISTDCVESGILALRLATEKKFDLILLDIMMPELDGFQTCIKLKSNPLTKDIPVIFITGDHNLDNISQAFKCGAVDYIIKPFHVDEVYSRIKTHIELQHAKEAMRTELIYRKKIQSQLQESEQKYRSLFENSSLAVCITNFDGTILDCNEAMCVFLGFSRSEMFQINLPSHYSDIRAHKQIIQSLVNNGTLKAYELYLKKNDGQITQVLLHANIIYLNAAKVILITLVDISYQKEMEKRILKAIIETEEKERSSFAQELHDGLGPILSTAKLYLGTLADVKTKDKLNEFIVSTNTSIDEALNTVTEISNKLSPHILRNFGIVKAIQSFIERIKHPAKPNIRLETNITMRFDEIIETTLYRVVIELLNNTLKYAGAKNIHIKFLKQGEKILLHYSDDGVGFDVNRLIKSGKGLGLYNIQNRIKSLNGDLEFSSAPDRGVLFTAWVMI